MEAKQYTLTIYLHRGFPTHAPSINVEDSWLILLPTVQAIAMGRGKHSLSNLLGEGTSCKKQTN